MVSGLRRALSLLVSWSIVWAGLTWPSLAFAAYSSVPSPPGYSGSGTARSYMRSAASTYTWAAGKVTAATSMSVAGRSVPMTVRFTAAANAAASMAQWLRINPAVSTGIAVASFLAPLLWNEGLDRWEKPGAATEIFICTEPTKHGHACTHAGAKAHLEQHLGYSYPYILTPTNYVDTDHGSYMCRTFNFSRYHDFNGTTGTTGYMMCGTLETSYGAPIPATEEDWDQIEAKPFPNAVPNEIEIPVPVHYPPALNPDEDDEPGTLRVPVGEPYAIPGTDPLEYRQPVVDVVPSPSPDDPLRVDLQPKNLSPESPEDGLDDPEVIDDLDENGDPVDLPPSKLCEDFPDISACAKLGDAPGSVTIPTVTRSLDFSEQVSFGPSTAACPAAAPISNSHGVALEFSYAGMCAFMDGIRPIVVGLAYLTAVGSFFGIGRRD
jgi:hypothetical protein